VYSQDGVELQVLKVKEILMKYKIDDNWKMNRKPDPIRVEQISSTFSRETPCLIDGVVSFWKMPGTNHLYIYDGGHRFSATLDFPENTLIARITEIDNCNLIKQDFININKSISLPFLFTEESNRLKIIVIESVLSKMMTYWPSRNPWKCNFNRDVLWTCYQAAR
jgi:hypothetical protein